jgi:S1-C subfamily serine protease
MDEHSDETRPEVPSDPTAEIPPTGRSGAEPTAQWPVEPPTDPYAQAGAFNQPPAGTPGGPRYSGPWQSSWGPTVPQWAPPPFEPPRRRGSGLTVLALAVSVALLLGAGVLIGHGFWTAARSAADGNLGVQPPSSGTITPTVPGSTGSVSGGPSNAGAIAARVDPGLVDIQTSVPYQQLEAFGTGVVLTSTGEVLTNNHVIEGSSTITVTDIGNGKSYSASVIGYSVNRDLAILQLHNASGLQTVTVGDSSKLAVGDQVVGIGNAQGAGGTPSYTGGTVTALNQSITASSQFEPSEQLTGLIQSNTDIQEGDSGGPLVDTKGDVVGLDTAASSGFSFQGGAGQSYSIPIDKAVTLAKEIENGQGSNTVHVGATAFLGVAVEPANASSTPFGGSLGIGGSSGTGSSPSTSGVAVENVVSGEPADQAGITAGDIITNVAGTTINTPSALTDVLLNYHPGDKVQVEWTDQSGTAHKSTVQLASGPPQ